ncbi:MAG: adenosylcobinamide-GDP ribazoletransferase [Bacteroidales bacterium]|nr:adenosylcobinamide-GDP ribazoletransferase [Bacteroidales bacterium]
MKHELKIFFTALMFFTRIPVPKSTGFSPENLNKATRYFPLIGIIVGGAGALVFLAAHQLLSVHIAILISIITMILLTGAFHEDALADFCDGFGGGYTKEKILAIMKDSRIGTYGAVGLILLLLAKFLLLAEFNPSQIPLILIAAHALSRVNPVILIFTSKYTGDENNSKSKPVGQKSSITTLILAVIFGLLPLVFISPHIIPFLIFAYALIFIYFRHYVHKKVGGYTGDVLGALQQFSEVGFYLTCLIVDKLI